MAATCIELPSASSKLEERSPEQKRVEQLKKLKELHLKRSEAQKLNHLEVIEDDRRQKLPANWETKRKWAEWELEEDRKKQEAAAQGEDYNRLKLLDIPADEAELWDRKKKKRNPDHGFADYEQSTLRQYQRLTKQIKPDADEYSREKAKMGDEFYPTANSLIVGLHKDTPVGIDRMVNDLTKQIDKRAKYSRRRAYDSDANIDFINERNMKFNKKLERFYGKYTAEIKQNLERGTAV